MFFNGRNTMLKMKLGSEFVVMIKVMPCHVIKQKAIKIEATKIIEESQENKLVIPVGKISVSTLTQEGNRCNGGVGGLLLAPFFVVS